MIINIGNRFYNLDHAKSWSVYVQRVPDGYAACISIYWQDGQSKEVFFETLETAQEAREINEMVKDRIKGKCITLRQSSG